MGLFTAPMSLTIFDSPENTRKLSSWLLVVASAALPISAIASIVMAWVAYAHEAGWTSLWWFALPVPVVLTLIAVVAFSGKE